jgi:hypothetical protein
MDLNLIVQIEMKIFSYLVEVAKCIHAHTGRENHICRDDPSGIIK